MCIRAGEATKVPAPIALAMCFKYRHRRIEGGFFVIPTIRIPFLAAVALTGLGLMAPAQAQQDSMSFFVTSNSGGTFRATRLDADSRLNSVATVSSCPHQQNGKTVAIRQFNDRVPPPSTRFRVFLGEGAVVTGALASGCV